MEDTLFDPTVLVVVAAYNESQNIHEVVRRSRRYGDVLVVDDASTDDTAKIATSAGAYVLKHQCNTHIQQAYINGFRWAIEQDYEYVIQMDAGLSHDPDEIPRLLAVLQTTGVEMVVGSRFVEGGRIVNPSPLRSLLSKGGSSLVRLVTGMQIRDVTSGFRGYRCGLLKTLNAFGIFDLLYAKAHAFQFEFAYRLYLWEVPMIEVPITYVRGRTSIDVGVVWEAIRTLLRMAWEDEYGA